MNKKASLGQVNKKAVVKELSKVIEITKKKDSGSTSISLRFPNPLLDELDSFLLDVCHGLGRSSFIKQAIVEKMMSMQ
jgi:hypothetical protein